MRFRDLAAAAAANPDAVMIIACDCASIVAAKASRRVRRAEFRVESIGLAAVMALRLVRADLDMTATIFDLASRRMCEKAAGE